MCLRLSADPCPPRRSPYTSPGPFPPIPPGTQGPYIWAISNTAGFKFQAAKRVAGGHVEAAIGDLDGSGRGLIGVYAFDVLPGQWALIVKTSGFVPGPVAFGELFRNAGGMPALYGTLTNGRFTNLLGVGSAVGLDVQTDQSEPVSL